ncbi:hypothetical protein WJ59_22825 [Burkholderia gladioli]|nr:hypothetical protein EDD84_25305 [Burkholderia gladioli]KVM63008.1 hypothetical protein WJ59_22825 [Burkholderia gladioli]
MVQGIFMLVAAAACALILRFVVWRYVARFLATLQCDQLEQQQDVLAFHGIHLDLSTVHGQWTDFLTTFLICQAERLQPDVPVRSARYHAPNRKNFEV